MKKTFCLVILSVCLLSCDNNVDPKKAPYFEVSIDPSYLTTQSTDWVLLHDKKGSFIDMKNFESGQTIVFDTIAGVPINEFVVTILNFIPSDQGDNFQIASYYHEDSGQKWKLTRPSNIFQGAQSGDLVVTVEDPNLGWDAVLSQKIDVGLLAAPIRVENKITFQASVFPAFKDIMLFATDKAGVPYYKFIKDVNPGTLKFSLKDFSTFDKMVDIYFPETDESSFLLYGYENGMDFIPNFNGYKANAFFEGMHDGLLRSSYKAAYISRFNKYYSVLMAYYGSTRLTHEAFGRIPESIIIPNDFNTSIQESSFLNFSLTDNKFDWMKSDWSLYEANQNGRYFSASWSIFTPSGDLPRLEWPKQLIEKYPKFNYPMQHSTTTLYKNGKTLDELISETFKGATEKQNYIQLSKRIL